jgi:hypothetical protein
MEIMPRVCLEEAIKKFLWYWKSKIRQLKIVKNDLALPN